MVTPGPKLKEVLQSSSIALAGKTSSESHTDSEIVHLEGICVISTHTSSKSKSHVLS